MFILKKDKDPQLLLLAMMFIMSFTFGVWNVLLNNFVVEKASFTGVEIGILQSLREVPGFLAFTAVFLLIFIREQKFALFSLMLLSIGVAATGFFPSVMGLYITTVLMSVGFHYFETINKSLTLQWLEKSKTAHFMGRALSIKAVASLTAYGLIWFAMEWLGVEYKWMYLAVGGLGFVATCYVLFSFPLFEQSAEQHKKLVFRKSYWLYYALTFMSGARRQIFIVFAGFMMVEKFSYSVGEISSLFIINYLFNFLFAARIGLLISAIGERRSLIIEYVGLIAVFVSYAYVEDSRVAGALYVIDHLFFAFAIAIHTYFQKIANEQDIAATASVSFTINHIAAVFIPAILGFVWVHSPTAVFLIGASFALISLILSLNIPEKPEKGNEMLIGRPKIGLT